MYGIKTCQIYISFTPPPLSGVNEKLRVALIDFTEAVEEKIEGRVLVKTRDPKVTDTEFDDRRPFFARLEPGAADRQPILKRPTRRAATGGTCPFIMF